MHATDHLSLDSADSLRNPQIPRAGANTENIITAENSPLLYAHVLSTQITAAHAIGDSLAGSCSNKRSLKASELTYRLVCSIWVLNIELRDLVSVNGAVVCDGDWDRNNFVPEISVSAYSKRTSWVG